jgi:hypothetical protein
MSAKTKDSLYLALGGAVVLVAGFWAFLKQSDIAELRTSPTAPSSGSAYEATTIAVTTPTSRTWEKASSQSAGERWVYDVFTPPAIFYNTETKQFTVVPPPPVGSVTDSITTVVDEFGPVLVKVDQPLFRLQLVGYVGEGANARGNFLNVQTGAVVFGTTGKKLPELKLEIVRFSAERRVVQQASGTTLVFTEATAVVRDTETGVETTLDAKLRTPEGPLAATLRLPDGTEKIVRTGDSFTFGDHTFRIGALQTTPPSVVVSKESGASAPQTETLLIPPPPPPPPPPDAVYSEEEPPADSLPSF